MFKKSDFNFAYGTLEESLKASENEPTTSDGYQETEPSTTFPNIITDNVEIPSSGNLLKCHLFFANIILRYFLRYL